ncbi:MAG: aldo/keto reductase [Bacteriovorax sp.]
MKQKILGTVQLGMPYGINNGVMPDRAYSLKLLEAAYDLGVRYLDSARAYGESLEIIGDYHRKNPSKKFKVFSKFMLQDITSNFSDLINNHKELLAIDQLEGFYFHRFNEYQLSSNLIEKLSKEEMGLVGVSLYSAQELEVVCRDPVVSIIQIPLSIFHHYSEIKKKVKEVKNKKIYARSIFLQGLLFMAEEKLTGNLSPFLKTRHFLEQTSSELNLSLAELAASYVMDMEKVDGVLFGAEKIEQVKDTESLLTAKNLDWDYILKKMPKVDDQLLNPGNWK